MAHFNEYWFKAPPDLLPSERLVGTAENVALYEEKQLLHEKGLLKLTNQRIIWSGSVSFFMNLDRVLSCSFDAGTWTKSEKIIIAVTSDLSFRLSFRGGGCGEIFPKLEAALRAKEWCYGVARKGHGIGIAGIQQKIQTRAEKTGLNISTAFEDLTNLMASAKEMVELSQRLMVKSQEKNLTDDEFTQFRGQLLTIGLKDSETTTGNSDQKLQQEIGNILLPAVEASSGIISLTEAYCRVNRARGLDLLSPEDLLSSLKGMKQPVKLSKFPSGLQVVQLSSLDEESWTKKIVDLLEERTCLSAEQLALILETSAVLAMERLLLVESKEMACRDDSLNGLVFYPNRFLQTEA